MAARKTVTFVTGSANKLKEVKAILGDSFPYNLESLNIDLPEYQGEPDDISVRKCRAAVELGKGGPLIVEDTCLCFNALGGLPGPYIKWFLTKLENEGLYKLLTGWEDKSAQAICTLAFCDGGEVKLFKGIVNGTIVSPRGPPLFGWDRIFQPDGHDRTYAELGPEGKDKISHRYLAVQAFRDYVLRTVAAT
ncbi:Inosine triphosphate pyrophosphatase [Halotydeus destructor]|nr:Inosine triphosphate pyrophosphatase [Halotydeus destructor]